MSRYELNKSVEARRLNPRTGFPTNDPPVTIPFGAILDNVVHDGDVVRYSYLMQQYESAAMPMRGALQPLGGGPGIGEGSQPAEEEAAAPEPDRPSLVFEAMPVRGLGASLSRARVPGGWLVAAARGATIGGLAFVPDSEHVWDGTTVE